MEIVSKNGNLEDNLLKFEKFILDIYLFKDKKNASNLMNAFFKIVIDLLV